MECPQCGRSLWKGRCARPRCSGNSAKHMRRHGERLRYNVRSCGGQVLMVTLTAPGARAGCPWDPTRCRIRGPHKHSGPSGCRVESLHASFWNEEIFDRFQLAHRRARERASRQVKGCGSRLLAKSPELQLRGVLHLHALYVASTAAEMAWVMAYVAALRQLAGAAGFGEQLKVGHFGPAYDAGGYVAKYVSKTEGMRAFWEDGRLPARAFYVSARVTQVTGVTMRSLKWQGRCWYEGLVVSTSALAEVREYQRLLGRELNRSELCCVEAVRKRGP